MSQALSRASVSSRPWKGRLSRLCGESTRRTLRPLGVKPGSPAFASTRGALAYSGRP